MRRVFANCYEMDRKCYESYALSEDILMEHAASGMATKIGELFERGAKISIVSGPGNNGADGIALSRLLCADYEVKLSIPVGVSSPMAKLQLDRARRVGVSVVEELPESADLIVDALFGAGLNRALPDELCRVIERLNTMEAYRVACDIPSGIDEKGRVSPVAFRADMTVTMGALKEALYLDEAKDYVGEIVKVDLGVGARLYEEESFTFVLEESDFAPPHRDLLCTHKGDYGHLAVFCGEKSGAGIISATAASRFGVGLTTLVVHERVEAPAFLMKESKVPRKSTAIAIGMGLGNHFESEMLEKEVLESDLPLLLDADAFYSRKLLEVMKDRSREVVLTPHPKEFSAMWKILENEELTIEEIQRERFDIVREFMRRYPSKVLLLKGSNMLIGARGRIYINPLGTPVLAKGGSGDVLSGIVGALLAQGYDSEYAAIQGSLALTAAAKLYEGADYSMLPTDIVQKLPKISDRAR